MPDLNKTRSLISSSILALIFILLPALADAYSYAMKESPIDKIFREGVAAARKGDWGYAEKKAKEGVALQKDHHFKSDFLLPEFRVSVAEKDVSKTAGNFAALVYLSIREKLFQNREEGLKNTRNSRKRLALSRQSYLNILDGNVKKQDFALSRHILKSFDNALSSLGNPGLFGIGKKPPDLASYDEASKNIIESLLKAFPDFTKF